MQLRRGLVGLAGALALALLGLSCAQDERWNVLIVTFDTTRADRLGPYGYEDARTPTLDAIAAEGVVFERAYTTNPITLPAHTSMMTGTFPVFHGVRNNSTYYVSEDLTTLAETLKEADYDTAAFVGAFVLDSQFNLDQGFDRYDDQVERDWSRDELAARDRNAFGFAERKANLVSLAATRWLRERESPQDPFFMWLHYFDPHEPKNPPEPHRSLSPAPYDAEIAFADEQFGYVLKELEKQGIYDRTLIVFTADHGEGLLDHGEPTHALLVFDTTVRIPMILRVPGGVGGQVDDRLASLVDVMPTVLDLLDIEPTSEQQGYSLVLPEGERPQRRSVYVESVVGRLQHGWSSLRALVTEDHKLIYGTAPRLYRISEDPGEVFNLSQKEPELLSQMEQNLATWIEQHRGEGLTDSVTVTDDEAIRKLQSLGYVVTTRASNPVSDSLETDGKDPHELRFLFDLFGVALENVKAGRLLRGINQLEEIVQVDPENLAGLNYLGVTYYQQTSQVDRARELLERSLALDPDQEEARYHLCRILFSAGDLEGARIHAEAILEFQPSSVAALYELGRIHATLGDEARAIEHYEAALERDDTFLPGLLSLGVLHAQQRRHDEAGVFLQRADDAEPGNPEVLYNIGIWHLQGEETRAAIRTLSQVISINARDPDAFFVLGRLLAEHGDPARARSVLNRALVLNATRQGRVAEIRQYLENLS